MERVDVLMDPLRAFLHQIAEFLPRLGVALLVLLAGFLLAKAARFAIVKGLRAINLHIVTQRSGVDGFLQRGGMRTDGVAVLGIVTYWAVILAALIIAFNSLGLTYVTELLGRVMLFVPKLLVALLVVIFGSYFARFVGHAVTSYCVGVGISDGKMLGRIARYAILTFVLILAVDQLEIGGTLVRTTFLILLAGVVFALALAFGLGGKDWAAARLEEWWPSDSRRDKP